MKICKKNPYKIRNAPAWAHHGSIVDFCLSVPLTVALGDKRGPSVGSLLYGRSMVGAR